MESWVAPVLQHSRTPVLQLCLFCSCLFPYSIHSLRLSPHRFYQAAHPFP